MPLFLICGALIIRLLFSILEIYFKEYLKRNIHQISFVADISGHLLVILLLIMGGKYGQEKHRRYMILGLVLWILLGIIVPFYLQGR